MNSQVAITFLGAACGARCNMLSIFIAETTIQKQKMY